MMINMRLTFGRLGFMTNTQQMKVVANKQWMKEKVVELKNRKKTFT